MNLLEETINKLKLFGKSEKDVLWVGDKLDKTSCWSFGYYGFWGIKTWKKFVEWANCIEYDNNKKCMGAVDISSRLVVVGNDWWLERWNNGEGTEGWSFKTIPLKKNYKKYNAKSL